MLAPLFRVATLGLAAYGAYHAYYAFDIRDKVETAIDDVKDFAEPKTTSSSSENTTTSTSSKSSGNDETPPSDTTAT